MNIYDFFNSPDVAEHCQSIGQKWTPFEMAVIIGQSGRTMTEKHTAWRELISDYPDMPTVPNHIIPAYDSLHKTLSDLIAYEECVMLLIKKQESGVFYEYTFSEYDSFSAEHISEHDELFPIFKFGTFEEAWNDAENTRMFFESKGYTVGFIKITKVYGASKFCEINAYLDTAGNLIDCCYFISPPNCVKLLPDIDKSIVHIFGWDYFYIYTPLPWVPMKYVMLNEDERMLFYKIQAIVDEFDPLHLWCFLCPADEYIGETRAIFNILQDGGGEKELRAYWADYNKNNTKGKKFDAKAEEATKKILALL
jgi:hypothetical protein